MSKHGPFVISEIKQKLLLIKKKHEVHLEDKVYPETYYHHTLG
jgi:hypothetical protein